MGLEQIVPALFFIVVLVLILPGFLRTNLKSKQFKKNLFIWFIIVVLIVIISYLIY